MTTELNVDALRDVDRVLLPSEPYPFREKHVAEVRALLPAGSGAEVAAIDGEMTSWYGSRAIEGLRYLRRYREQIESSKTAG